MSSLRPEYGPTLPALLAKPLRQDQRRIRAALLGLAVLAVVVLVVVGALRGGQALEPELVRGPVAFTLAHTSALDRVAPGPGEVLRLRTPAGASVQMTYVARPIRLDPYTGDPTAQLAVRASREGDDLARTLPGFVARGDGKTRVNDAAGYALSFQTRLAGRTAYAKRFYLVPPVAEGAAPPRDGIELTLTGTRGDVFPNVNAIGANGALKAPLRSFRFGTERP